MSRFLIHLVVGAIVLSSLELPAQQAALPPTPNLSTPGASTGDAASPPSTESAGQTRPGLLAPERDSLADLKDNVEMLEETLATLPEEAQDEGRKAWDRFEANDVKLAEAMGNLREVQLTYRNGFDQTPQAIVRFREQRNEVWQLMREQFTAALDVIRFLPSSEAASYLVTMVQYRHATDIYDEETFEAAARLLDIGENYRFLYQAAARSAVVSGKFESAKQIYDALKQEDLEEADLKLKFQLEIFEKQFKREQAAIEASDVDSLPQVRIETTMGSFLIELFPDSAPSAVGHFLKLVKNGFYDGMDWSVVTENVLALTGDGSGDGRGNSSEFLIDEHENENARDALRGSVIMAKLPAGTGAFIPNSASSQFAIPFLPLATASKNQTIIGRVIEGMDVVSRLRRVDPTKEKKKGEVILPPDSIITTEIVRPAGELPQPKYVDMQKEFEKAVKAGMLKPSPPQPQ